MLKRFPWPLARWLSSKSLHEFNLTLNTRNNYHYFHTTTSRWNGKWFTARRGGAGSMQIGDNLWLNSAANRYCRWMCSSRDNITDESSQWSKSQDITAEELEHEYDLMYEKLYATHQLNRVLIVHPNVKWGRNKDTLSTPDLRVDEAAALMDTLNSQVMATTIESLKKEDSKTFFGKGKVQELRDMINTLKQKHQITAVFLNTTQLKPRQRQTLQKLWSCPIYDRYGIVLQIFKRHARTQEAKIQVELASLNYLRYSGQCNTVNFFTSYFAISLLLNT